MAEVTNHPVTYSSDVRAGHVNIIIHLFDFDLDQGFSEFAVDRDLMML